MALLVAFGIQSASAQVEPMSLASVMKTMNNKLKTIASQAKQPAMNAQSAALADDVATNSIASKTYVPGTVSNLPASQQAAAKAEYDKMLDETARLSQELAAAFRANNNALAGKILVALNQNKKDGHDKFK
jgi:hypothetical protein